MFENLFRSFGFVIFFLIGFTGGESNLAKASFSGDLKVRYSNARIDRSSSATSSFTIVSNNSYNVVADFGWHLGKSFNFYLGGDFSAHEFVPPGSRTLTDAKANAITAKLGGKYNFGDLGIYLEAEQKPLFAIVDPDLQNSTLVAVNSLLGKLGTELKAKAKSFRLVMNIGFGAPAGTATFVDGDMTLKYMLDGAVKIEFGKNFLYGFSAQTTLSSYDAGDATYTSNDIFLGLFSQMNF